MRSAMCLESLYSGMTGEIPRGLSVQGKNAVGKGFSFGEDLSAVQEMDGGIQGADSVAYKKHLEEKFGVRVTAKYFQKDQASMDRLGGSMCGNDVVIAPNILEQMAANREKACYYEKKIQHYFDSIPRWKGECAAMGLTYEPCGVAIHEDGTVYYIGGGTEMPERKAKIEAAKKAKAARKLKHWQEQQDYNKWLFEHKRIIAKAMASDIVDSTGGMVV